MLNRIVESTIGQRTRHLDPQPSAQHREDRRAHLGAAPRPPTRWAPLVIRRPTLLLLWSLFFFAACSSDEPPTPLATASAVANLEVTATPNTPPLDILPTITATPTAPPATPSPAAAPSGLWAFDVARGKQVVLYQGAATVASQIDASDNAATTTITDEGGTTAVRFRPDGTRIEEHADRSLIVTAANGDSRFYLNIKRPRPRHSSCSSTTARSCGSRARDRVSASPSRHQENGYSSSPSVPAQPKGKSSARSACTRPRTAGFACNSNIKRCSARRDCELVPVGTLRCRPWTRRPLRP